tara:strand:- start:1107 stop:2066 length:960 start_codon:yes stop_codon:yes gene_type:complete
MKVATKIRNTGIPLTLIKISATALLVYYAISSVTFDNLIKVIYGIDPRYFFPIFALWFFNQILTTLRWAVLLPPLNFSIPFKFLFRSTMIGHFANYYVPGEWGVDASWFWTLHTRSGEKLKPIVSLAMDKLIALSATLFVSLVSWLLGQDFIASEINQALFPIYIFVFITPFIFIIFAKHKAALPDKMQVFFSIFHDIWRSYGMRYSLLTRSLSIAILARVITVIFIWLLAQSIGMRAPSILFFILVPLILIISSIPIAFQNIGVKEGLYVYFFTHAGVPAEEALGLALLVVVWSLGTGLVCSVAYLTPDGIAKPRGAQ